MDTRPERIDRSEAAARIAAAYAIVARWGAREFKRRTPSLGMTATQLAILALVDTAGGMTVSQLAERLDLSGPTVVRAADALERKRLIVRQRSAEDRREVRIACTPEGKEARATLESLRKQRITRLLAGMTDGEVQALLAGYEAMARAASEQDSEEQAV